MKAPKGTILNRSFECVHSGKPLDEAKNGSEKKKAAAEERDPTINMSTFVGQKARSKQAEAEMDPNDTRQRNKMARYGCKAHMHVGKRQGQWTCTVFVEEHTHALVRQIGRKRYYRSHRKVPEEDFQLLQTLHEQNINTTKIMGCLGSVHGGDPRCLGYVKKDVLNIRSMLRDEVSL
jgi:hypothetical protein